MLILIELLSGCQNSSKESFVIIATDHLSFQDSNCSRDWAEQNSGIASLCKESVRWTHAFTTSLQSGPALSSILTGLHPNQTRYRHNGQYLDPNFKNVAQVALDLNYRTAFFSGGPPIFKKTGLDSGFEIFDDSLNLNESPFLKPFKTTNNNFYDWLLDLGQNSPFFSVIYVPDLRFTSRTTMTSTGEIRNKSFESQLEEFDSVLYELIAKMKKLNRWDKTHFVLIGLQGRNFYDREKIFPQLNLHSENTQVTLLWKPAQKKRDSPLSWTMDKNISLADVGRTLFELLNEKAPESKPATASLALTLLRPESLFSSTRYHLIESGWGEWKLKSPIMTAILNEEELYLNSKPPKLFKTLADRLEISPIISNEFNKNTFDPYIQISANLEIPQNEEPQIESHSLWSLGYNAWSAQRLEPILQLYETIPYNEVPIESRAWLARALVENGEWKRLKAAGEAWKNLKFIWLANKNLYLPRMKKEPHCLDLVSRISNSGSDLKKCADVHFIETLFSLEGMTNSKKWEKNLEDKLKLVQILKANRAFGSIWDIEETEENILSLTEMLFWTPEFKSLLKPIQKKIKLVDLESP
jgi:hypothetical protein